MNDNIQPSKLKYIGAWILASLISNVLQRVMDFVLGGNLVKGPEDLTFYFIIVSLLTIPIISGSFIFVYNLFKSLNVKKVMMYIYILGALGTAINLFQTKMIYKALNLDSNLNIFYISSIISFIISVYLIRSYYIKKPERWF